MILYVMAQSKDRSFGGFPTPGLKTLLRYKSFPNELKSLYFLCAEAGEGDTILCQMSYYLALF